MRVFRPVANGLLALALAASAVIPAHAQSQSGSATNRSSSDTSSQSAANQGTQPDNTKLNKSQQPTADQQNNAKADRDLTQKIRRAITSDKQMSTYARNVKVITQDGKVTLKGPVRSDQEKQAIEDKATEIAGQGNVTNDINVAPSKKG